MSTPDPLEKLKNGMRNAWMAGDFGRIARFNERVAANFVDRLQLQPGVKVLDVACGSGNLAIPAARAGAEVTGVDIDPNLLEQARRRAEAENLTAKFDEGDAEKLPYADASFDVVMSMFGLCSRRVRSLSPRSWPASAAQGEQSPWPTGRLRALPKGGSPSPRNYLPPPEGVPAPVLWGDESIVRQRLAAHGMEVQTRLQQIILDFPFPPKQLVGFYREYFGPAKTAFSRMDSETRSHYAADLEAFWTESNLSTEGRTVIQSEYLEVVGRKR